ncbi:MAG: hypothetical protein NVS9B1_25250 [Candidatus Dormibacteraceae bacterium]
MEHALCPVLIGREVELSELEDALLAARRGDGQVVVLAGDAGMGKTRRATELQQRARRLGMSVLWGGCSEAELALPYLPFLEAIGNYLAGADVEAVRSRLGPVRRELAHLFPQLEPAGVAPDVDSTQGRMRLYEAVLALLDLAASEGGLLLLIEDLHWADASTRELLDYLTRRLRNARIMVLATHRSDEVHRRHPLLPLIQGWRRSSSAKIVELAPLTPDKVAKMVIAIFDLGANGVADDTRDFLHVRTEGNPFVLEEMLKAALDRGDIYRGDAGWTRKALDDFRLPDSVRDTILLRLDRLSQQQVDILRAAATLGNNFSYDLLVTVSGRPAAEVREAVEACVLQQLLADDPRRSDAGYRFRHALTREAIYDDIITPTRHELHGLAADALLSSGGTPVEVSLHLLAAGRAEEAIPFCLEAAARAELEYAHADAADLYERVLPFLVDQEQRATILCQLGAALHGAGRSSTAYDYLKAGIALLDQVGQVPHAAHFRVLLGRCAWEVGKPADAVAALERARVELEPAGPSADLAITYARLASMRLFEQDGAGCVNLAEAAMSIAEAAGATGVFLQAQMYHGAGLLQLGRVEEGIELEDRSFAEAVEAGLYSVAIVAFNNCCTSRVVHFRAAEVLERLPLFIRVPDSNRKSIVLGMSEGQAAYVLGDVPRALAAFTIVHRVAQQDQAPVWIRRSQAWLAACYFAAGQPDRAREILPDRGRMAEISVHDLLNFDVMTMQSQLALGATGAAVGAAGLILNAPPLAPILNNYLASWACWTYLTADQPDLAAQAVRAGLDPRFGITRPISRFPCERAILHRRRSRERGQPPASRALLTRFRWVSRGRLLHATPAFGAAHQAGRPGIGSGRAAGGTRAGLPPGDGRRATAGHGCPAASGGCNRSAGGRFRDSPRRSRRTVRNRPLCGCQGLLRHVPGAAAGPGR